MLNRKISCLLLVCFALNILLCGVESGWSYKKQPKEYGRGQNQQGKIKSLIDEAETLGRESSTKEQLDQAISLLIEALEMADSKDVPSASARACAMLGLIYLWRSDYGKALQYSQRAIVEGKRGGNCKAQTSGERTTGIVYMARGDYVHAERSFLEAIRTAETCGDKLRMAWTLRELGRVYRYQDSYSQALTLLQKGLAINSEIGNQELEGYLRKEMGGTYTSLGQYTKAANFLANALSISEQIDNSRLQQESLDEMGKVYLNWGKYREAANCFRKTMDLARRLGQKRMEAQALLSLGEVYTAWGRYTDALSCFQKALSMAQATGIVMQESRVLMDMGKVFSSRGQYTKAITYFEQALKQFQAIGNAQGEAGVLNSLGLVYQGLGEFDDALVQFHKSLEIYRRIGSPVKLVSSCIGNLCLDMGDVPQAERFIQESGNVASLGRLCLVKSDYPSAKKHYENLLKSADQNRNANDLFTAYTGLGMVNEATNDLSNAAEYYRKAVDHTEDLRSNVSPAEREMFFDVKINGFHRTVPYDGLARTLVKMNRAVEGFKESEYTRARIFSETLTKRVETPVMDVPTEVRETDAMLMDQLAALTKNLQTAYENSNKELIAALEPQVREVKENRAAFIDTVRAEHPLFAATRYPQPMSVEKTALRDDEWVLAYHVTDPGIIIYITQGKKLSKAIFKPIAREQVDNLVRKYRAPLEMKGGDNIIRKLKQFDFSAGKELSDVLLADVLPVIPRNCHIIVIPDDFLGALPFEMLLLNSGGKISTDGEIPYTSGVEFLGDRNPISYCQSVTALTLARVYGNQVSPNGKLLILADPVFQTKDPRYAKLEMTTQVEGMETSQYGDVMALMGSDSDSGTGIPRLVLTSDLAENLTRMYGTSVECCTGLQASKEKFLKLAASGQANYDKIVFATHGYFGKDLPGIREPVLILNLVPPGTDGLLRMSEVMSLKMNADIVALTACQTGLGKKISGEGTMGMGRAFQYAGAKSVLMTLWSVAEKSSVMLVENFFRYKKESKSNLEALKLARDDIRKQGFDHPFFWAPFILVGEAN